jgi:hypothetical protein
VIEMVGGKPCVAVVGLSDRQNRILAQRCGMLARLVFIPLKRRRDHDLQGNLRLHRRLGLRLIPDPLLLDS